MKSIHVMQFWFFDFSKQKICTQRCGRIFLERMAIVKIILLKEFLPYISCDTKGTKLQRMYRDKKKQYLGIPSLVHFSCDHELICLVYEGESL